jgi:hypothetical protein
MAVFLVAYRGYEGKATILGGKLRIGDNLATNIAGIGAAGVALFPTGPGTGATSRQAIIGVLHRVSAAAFLISLAVVCLYLFTKSAKPRRNRVYRICGRVILGCLVLMVANAVVPKGNLLHSIKPLYWLEAAAVVAFGVAWLVKGEAHLAVLGRLRGDARKAG